MHLLPYATLDSGSCGPKNSYYHQWSPQTLILAMFCRAFFCCGGGFLVLFFGLVWFFAGGFMLPMFYLIFKVKQWKRGSLD